MAKGFSASPGRLVRDDGRVEAVRFYKSEGAGFSGWVIRSTTDRDAYSDPVRNKPEAIEVLLGWIED